MPVFETGAFNHSATCPTETHEHFPTESSATCDSTHANTSGAATEMNAIRTANLEITNIAIVANEENATGRLLTSRFANATRIPRPTTSDGPAGTGTTPATLPATASEFTKGLRRGRASRRPATPGNTAGKDLYPW